MTSLEDRVAALEARTEALLTEMRAEIEAVAHKLRADDEFMRPASQKFTDHAGAHVFNQAARKLLILVIGVLAAAAYGVAAWLTGRGFTP